MKIKIKPKPIATATMNLERFENHFKKTFDLEDSVMCNLEVQESEIDDNDKIKKFILLGTNWGNLFMVYPNSDKKEINFSVFQCDVENNVIYNPEELEYAEATFNFENKEVNKTDFLILNDVNPKIEAQIEHMIGTALIDYVTFDWKKVFTFTAEDFGEDES